MDMHEIYLKKDEKTLKEIFESSLSGTLAYAESEYYLLLLLEQKVSEMQGLGEDELEEIAGGASLKSKALASLAAAISLLSSGQAALAKGSTPTQQTAAVTAAKKSKENYKQLLNKVNKYLSSNGKKKWGILPDARYVIKELSDEQLKSGIEKEKNRFISLEKNGHFKIEEGVEETIDPKIFLLSLRKINDILEKYGNIQKAMLEILNREKATFKIHSFDNNSKNENIQAYVCYYYSTSKKKNNRYFNIFLSKKYLKDFSSYFLNNVKGTVDGWHPYVERGQIAACTAAHEMGHVLEDIIIECLTYVTWDYACVRRFVGYNPWYTPWDETYNQHAGKYHTYLKDKIKEKIIEIAKQKYGAKDSLFVSKYAKTNSAEWFAEVFANLECAEEEDISPYGKAMRDLLNGFDKATIEKSYLKDLIAKSSSEYMKMVGQVKK